MTYPSFNDFFDPAYQAYSVKNRAFTVPAHFDLYQPDNSDDFDCFSVISPALERAATEWTLGGKWISIGIYRDEGRPVSSVQRVETTWVRSDDHTKLVFEDLTENHLLRVGMKVNVYPVGSDLEETAYYGVEVKQILSPRSFSVDYVSIGDEESGGTALWQLTNTRGLNTSWTRSGGEIIFTTLNPHERKLGDLVDAATINVSQIRGLPVHQVYTPYIFSIFSEDLDTGVSSGSNATWQPVAPEIFSEENSVFRLLPSFKLIPVALVEQIFTLTQPDPNPQRRELYNITTEDSVLLPTGKNKSTNYDLPATTVPRTSRLSLETRFGQIYDEEGKPLEISYRADGNPTEINNVDSKYKNEKSFLNPPLVNEGADPEEDTIVYAYDFYGFPLNAEREPYDSTLIIERDDTVPAPRSNFRRQETNSQVVIYPGKVFDVFGNEAVGIQENNALNVKKSILPLQLDRFNKPVKQPVRRR